MPGSALGQSSTREASLESFIIRAKSEFEFLYIASPQQGDLRLSGPPSGQGAGSGARTRDRRVPADLRADSQATVLPMPRAKSDNDANDNDYDDRVEDVTDDAAVHAGFSRSNRVKLRSDYSLVCIILFDLQSRKFQRRLPLPEELGIPTENNTAEDEPESGLPTVSPDLDETCLEIEEALLSRKTRLQSNIAKERIKRNAPSIEHLLPEQVRNKDETKSVNPVFCWVNQMKISMTSIIESLTSEGFQELEDDLDISEQSSKVFKRDPHCCDLLVFPPHLNMYLKDSEWVAAGQLVQQDKSSCLAPQTVQLLLGIDQDVIHVNVGTGLTTGHIASLLRHKSSGSHIWAFEPGEAEKTKKAVRNLEFLGVKNTKVIPDHFLNSDPEDIRYRNVRAILITANCSKSAITSPVQFIVSEGEDMQILGELSQAESNITRIRELTHDHESLLRHALKFPRVQAVVYTTRSRYQAENEHVVNQVLDAVNGLQNGKKLPFRVTPPVLPFSGDEIGTEGGVVDGKFARFQPSDRSNGCFVAILSRE
ncbi:25S rRNA (cytosine-c(5))-methyltransferase rcm1, partial [Plakobranchus ocellatus]